LGRPICSPRPQLSLGLPKSFLTLTGKRSGALPRWEILLFHQDLAEHYDNVVIPAQVRKPMDKAKSLH